MPLNLTWVNLAFSCTKGYPGQVKRDSLPSQVEAALKYLVVPLTFAHDFTSNASIGCAVGFVCDIWGMWCSLHVAQALEFGHSSHVARGVDRDIARIRCPVPPVMSCNVCTYCSFIPSEATAVEAGTMAG